ncbi:hypothetical protein IFM89_036928 [Coptis chinensis]|uniref:Uncharacterized protein n=1 Tax=Coptis chinensis TaxID=261450 RepID=A0A835HZD4_9MAGN|nr:hypothetical protein IFM89_036928 [Coptis chinensis]
MNEEVDIVNLKMNSVRESGAVTQQELLLKCKEIVNEVLFATKFGLSTPPPHASTRSTHSLRMSSPIIKLVKWGASKRRFFLLGCCRGSIQSFVSRRLRPPSSRFGESGGRLRTTVPGDHRDNLPEHIR